MRLRQPDVMSPVSRVRGIGRLVILGATALAALAGAPAVTHAAHPRATPSPNVRDLSAMPTTDAGLRNPGEIRWRRFVAHDARSQPLRDVPATIIEVITGLGDWNTTADVDVPVYGPVLPDAVRPHVQLFYNEAIGWMVVPRGWRLRRAAVGADGNAVFAYTALGGASQGWMSVASVPACGGCILAEMDGLFPEAHRELNKLWGSDAPSPHMTPKLLSLSHPDPCTASFTYRPAHSPPVTAIIQLTDRDHSGLMRLDLAMPPDQRSLGAYIFEAFRTPSPRCEATEDAEAPSPEQR